MNKKTSKASEEKTTRKQQAMNTRMKIMKVTMDLFREKGVESVKINDICEAAGISTGAFYHHFASKDKIIQNGYESIDSYLQEQAGKLPGDTATERLFAFFRLSNGVMEEMGWPFISEAYRHILQTKDKYTLSRERFPYRHIYSILEDGKTVGEFRSNLDVEEAADYLMKLVRGITFDWCVCEGSYSLTEEAARTLQLVVREYHK